ncbi:hypothetical protein DY023_09610 [Microbacterium bovistercoris]|uniref:Peptidase n=1 Tax=Microbacterium bovistercoris TaxID=2293570 RepID=A0A371NUU4_9MICO|nr:Trp biosynthesis-associated membrane protein [Microbacterium bovistercoris]REJ05495.1 hypothetical protein DY023_09610 [Microbacterium bovistercoris]
MSARGRLIAVLGFLLAGGIGVISATQTWLTVTRVDGSEPILVAGSDAVALLAPLSLAVLALGAALSIVGLVLRYIFAALAAAAGVVLIIATVPLVAAPPLTVVAGPVAEKTGLAGDSALHEIVAAITPTAWPVIALCCWFLVLLTAIFAVVTAKGWKSGGRRYRTDDAPHTANQGPLDAVDSWDDLSRGTDPTR